VLVAVLDMGWEHLKIALDYEGGHHGEPLRFKKDIRRYEAITDLGWIDIRVTSEDTEARILDRLERAWARRVSRVRARSG
jgi:very-short-patch-repair endonuclease